MRLKIALLFAVVAIGAYSAYACGKDECGGGKTQCCKDRWGALYFAE